MLSEAIRKSLCDRRDRIARCIISTNSGPTKYTSDQHMRSYLKELSEIEDVLAGRSTNFTSYDLAQGVAENHAYRNAFNEWLRLGNDMSERSRNDLKQYESRATLATEGTPYGAAYP